LTWNLYSLWPETPYAWYWWYRRRFGEFIEEPQCEGARGYSRCSSELGIAQSPPLLSANACHLRCSGLPLNHPNWKGLNALFFLLFWNRVITAVVGHSKKNVEQWYIFSSYPHIFSSLSHFQSNNINHVRARAHTHTHTHTYIHTKWSFW